MAGKMISPRRVLFAQNSVTIPGSWQLVEARTNEFNHYGGMVSCVGSATLRYRFAITSGGPYLVSSSVACSSGFTILDDHVYGQWTDWAFTAANSQVMHVLIFGEPSWGHG